MSLDIDTPVARALEPRALGKVVALPRVGGMHHRYVRGRRGRRALRGLDAFLATKDRRADGCTFGNQPKLLSLTDRSSVDAVGSPMQTFASVVVLLELGAVLHRVVALSEYSTGSRDTQSSARKALLIRHATVPVPSDAIEQFAFAHSTR